MLARCHERANAMSTHNLRISASPLGAAHGAPWAARAKRQLSRFGRAVWQTLEDSGRRRAARELLLMAQRFESSDPALAQRLRDASRFDFTS
jgi:hypothetical protein